MPFFSKLFATKTRMLVLLIVLSLTLAACDTVAETDPLTFDGPPVVTIASPLNGDTYQEGVGVNILLSITNAGPDIARIAIEVDDQIIGEAILPNQSGDPSFTVSNGWPASGEGPHVITAIASRSDGTVSEEASVTINVVVPDMADDDTDSMVDDDPTEVPVETQVETVQEQPTAVPQTNGAGAQSAPTQAAAPTEPPAPTAVPPTNTPSQPQASVQTGANVRSGPGLVFDPPIGSLAAGETVPILAVNNAGTWYKIQYYNGDAWISSVVVNVTGNTTSLPCEAGPPTPIPPSPVPPTNTPLPASNVDLFIDEAQSNFVPTFVCAQASTINITIVNAGTETSAGGVILIEDVQPNGSVGASTETVFGELGPNASVTVQARLTVATFVNEVHTFRARVDSNNTVAESNENNNVWDEVYTLEPGGC